MTDYYIEARYPVHWPQALTQEETEQARDAAQHIRDTLTSLLG